MATFPVVITQEEIIDLTMEDMDINKTDNPPDTLATTSDQVKNKTDYHESKPEKNLSRRIFITFYKNKAPSIIKNCDKNKKKTKKPNIPLKNPKTIQP